jgi:cell division protein FtsL
LFFNEVDLGALAKIFFVPSIDFCIPATYLMLKLTEFHHFVLSPLDTYAECMVEKPSEARRSVNEAITIAKVLLSMLGIIWISAIILYVWIEEDLYDWTEEDLGQKQKKKPKLELNHQSSFFKKIMQRLKLPGNLEVAFGMLTALCVIWLCMYINLFPRTPGGVAVAVDISTSSLEDTNKTPEVAEVEGAKHHQLPDGETVFWVVLLVVTTCLTTILYFV